MAKESVYKSLLDCWLPPEPVIIDDGKISNPVPISFITSTFTFDSEFFDDECLTRFLSMETERENDGTAFLIEREDKLAGLHSGIVLVDQCNCNGQRTLRWDLVPCRMNNGVMHAKISILHWSNCIRVIIGSANLTESGFCQNQEIFGIVDYYPDASTDLKIIDDSLSFIQILIDQHSGEVVRNRYNKQKSETRAVLRKWNISDTQYKKDDVSLRALFVFPKEQNVLRRLRDVFDEYSSTPPHLLCITSPFYDKSEYTSTPSIQAFEILRKRGSIEIIYNITTEPLDEISSKLIANAPEYLQNAPTEKKGSVFFRKVSELGVNEDGKSVPRPLHMKSIWLANDDIQLYMVGSSNFTSAALGTSNRTNYEANLVYVVSKERNRQAFNLLEESYLATDELDTENLIFRARVNEDEENAVCEFLSLPLAFGEASVSAGDAGYILTLNMDAAAVPNGFEIFYKENEISYAVLAERDWRSEGSERKVSIPWKRDCLPDSLLVSWTDSNGIAFWPVVVESQIILPPVEVLKDLPLEALLQILSSSQPLHRLLGLINKIKNKKVLGLGSGVVVDPHKMVDTTGFLLQRTRRISYALTALRLRLEKPVFTKESLEWKLYGPIGVEPLVKAIKQESKNEEEKRFLLAELALELSRVRPETNDISLKAKEIKNAIRKIIARLQDEFTVVENSSAISAYSEKAIQKALHEL